MVSEKIFLIFAILFMGVSCGSGGDGPQTPPEPPEPEVPIEPVYYDFIQNPDFDEPIDAQMYSLSSIYDDLNGIYVVGGWKFVGGWNTVGGEVFRSETEGVDGSPCLGIRCKNAGTTVDLTVAQVIEGLDPKKTYRVSAKVKVRNVNNGFGATICSGNGYCLRADKGILGTTSWRTVNFDIDHAPEGKALICLRLGYSGATSDGTAYFDEITISDQSELIVSEGEYVKVSFAKDKLSIPIGNLAMWVNNLDKMYIAYKDLFGGRTPFKGNKIRVRGMADFSAWAWAGYPILWNSDYISSELQLIYRGHWSFGIMHEMGHNFSNTIGGMGPGNTSWNFNEELFANFRMYLAMMEVPSATVIQTIDGQEYTFKGRGIGDMYKITYDKTLGAGLSGAGGDGIQYTFVRIAEKYGQKLFKDAFDYLYELPVQEVSVGVSNWDKFNFFLDTLNLFVDEGEDVRSTYSQSDLNLIRAELTQ